MRHLIDQAVADDPTDSMIGLQHGKIVFTPLARFPDLVESDVRRPVNQGWMALQPVADVMAGTYQ